MDRIWSFPLAPTALFTISPFFTTASVGILITLSAVVPPRGAQQCEEHPQAQWIKVTRSKTVWTGPRSSARMAKETGTTENLKTRDPMRWVGLMSAYKAQIKEIIFTELVYC